LHLELASDLAGYRAPPVEHEESSKFRREQAARKAKREKDDEKSRASWVNFRTALQADPDQLRRPENLASWKAGMFRLRDLTYWLEHKTAHGDDRAPRDWRLLEEGFGRPVAEAYRDGMTALWRVVEPARPLRTDGGGITRQWPNVLAYAGIGIAAGEAGDWADRLGEPEAERCARHACMAEEGCPEWLDRLVVAHPRAVLPLLEGELVREWQIAERWHADFLYRYASREVALSPPVQELLVKTFASGETAHAETLERAIAIVAKLDLDMTRRSELAAMSAARFTSHAAAGNEAFAIGYLAIRFLVDPAAATAALTEWLAQDAPAPGVTRAARTLSRLFDGHHNGLIVGALDHTSVAMLEQLLQCAYRHIRPADDVHHVGTFSPDSRDGAETARNTILSKLMDRPGADAFWTIRKLADEPEFADRLQRFRELAHEKAERDSEPPAWRPSEVCAFAETHTSPAKTGADLLRVVLGVLDDINFQLHKGDVTSRPLLERATGENEVRNWLTEQLTLRARGRFHAYREAEVADSDRPDIVVASTSAQCEIAIEVKHGGKPWSLRQLDHALHTQLAEDYLKPETRRYGILVISQHDNRVRIDTETGERLEFNELIARLKDAARAIVRNSSGAIEVTCVGIDATEQQVP
jgi:hypothetical protein